VSETFLFDDFFASDDDQGIEATVRVKGRDIPLRIKTDLSLQDQQEVEQLAIKKRVTPDGKIVVDGVDEALLVAETLARTIKSWPFTYRDGSPVPVNPANVLKFCAEGGSQLGTLLKSLKDAREAALDPSAGVSDAA
jgi:hypothetical protein